jgi:putative endonuclease
MNKRQKGNIGEDAAAGYLKNMGYGILERNYRYDRGEIDIIADDGGTLVFVEVKARRSKAFGEPEEAITEYKKHQLEKVAEGYLVQHSIEDRECRFDVIAISWENGRASINHIQNAF